MFLINLFGRWTKKTRVEASRQKLSLSKAVSSRLASSRQQRQDEEQRQQQQQQSQQQPQQEQPAGQQQLKQLTQQRDGVCDSLPKGWTLSGDCYVHLLLGETRSLEEPPSMTIMTMEMVVNDNADIDEGNGVVGVPVPAPVCEPLPGYPRVSDIEKTGRNLEEKFNTWLRAFDLCYVEAGDLMFSSPNDDSFKDVVCCIVQLMDEFTNDVLRSRLVEAHDPYDFNWENHYVTRSIFSTPNEISKDVLTSNAGAFKGSAVLKASINKIWSDSKALKATRSLMTEIYKLKTVCELCEPRHRILSETLQMRIPLLLNNDLHKVLKTPGGQSNRKRKEGSIVAVIFPAVVSPSQSNAVLVPALVL
eukprot:TRINITY_DN7060_c0_g1_i1.p1 TRINITY_DN7060_c0_g1~~TRINITY_DN7060_c0_g1_i1.p1  ORF type:complete len:361 (+),score=69.33 TRINITY_DN7060_c0_g1_i1:264-1346(+)